MRVCIVLTARPSWSKLSPVCAALRARGAELQIVVCASALLERYGNVSRQVEAEGYAITERVFSVYEGATLETCAIEVGALYEALARTYQRLKPDMVIVCADRREILAAAGAAKFQHIAVVHLQGGEHTGSIDNSVRDAVTHLADYHFVCTARAQMRVYAMTGAIERIWNFGCSSIDLAAQAHLGPPVTLDELAGVGAEIDLAGPFITLLQHPVTNEPEAYAQMRITLEALSRSHVPLVAFWPGEDAGQEQMGHALRQWREQHPHQSVRYVKNLPPSRFLKLLTQTRCLVGNSSAGIRECSFLGTPVVNVGSRQHGRERGPNVVDVPYDADQIQAAVERQRKRGKYPSSGLYGKGDAAERIAEVVCGRAS